MGRRADRASRILTLNLLGTPEIRLGTDLLPSLPSRKATALLVFLAVESSRPHDRKLLASLLWPDVSEEKALASLRQSLLALRRALGDEQVPSRFLEAGIRTVRFNPSSPHRLDLDLLESPSPECRVLEDPETCSLCARHLATAAEGIRGPFLEGFDLPGCEEFEAWIEGVRERTRTLAIRTIERLVRFSEREGDLTEAIRLASRGLRIDPFDERGHRRLMRLLTASGDRRAAELQFEACRNILVRELGVPPEPETLALLREIREGRTRWESLSDQSSGCPETLPVTVLFFDGCPDIPADGGSPLPSAHGRLLERIPDFVSRRGGLCVSSHGGTWLAWFGLGQFREGAARRAARTALELADLFRREDAGSVRAGLHAGTAVANGKSVPDSSGSAERIAMSLCMQADAGDLLVSKSAAALLAGQFVLEPASGLRVPAGVGAVFRLRGISASPDPLEEKGDPPLVGREKELSLFRKLWKTRRRGVLILEGPPGIGKSRLLRSLVASVRSGSASGAPFPMDPVIRTLECLPQYSDSPFFPLIRMMRGLLGIPWEQEETVSRERIRTYVRDLGLSDSLQAEDHLADLLGLPPLPGTGRRRNASGAARRRSMEEIVLAILRIRVQDRLLLVVEDLHWADDSTRRILRKALEDPGLSRRVLSVLTVREGESPPWADRLPDVHTLRLSPLSEEESRRMVRNLVGEERLPEAEARAIVQAGGGVPLYLAESVRLFLNARIPPSEPSRPLLPRTVDELLSDRLARLPKDRPLLQRAAVIGRMIPLELFRAISPEPPEILDRFLRRMIRSGLLSPKSDQAEETVEFCHLLFQEAAARSLVPEERKRLHIKVGETLQSSFPRLAEATPELLAWHFEEGGRADLAASWYEKAAGRSFARGAFTEARDMAEAALRLLRSLPDNPKDSGKKKGTEARLLVLLGKIRMETEGLGMETGEIFRKAQELVRQGPGRDGTTEEVFHSLFGQFQVNLASGHLAEAQEILNRIARIVRMRPVPAYLECLSFANGQLLFHRGDFSASLETLSGPDPDPEHLSFLPGGFGRQRACFRTLALWIKGNFAEVRDDLARITDWAEEKDGGRGFFFLIMMFLFRLMGETGAVLETAEKILAHAEEIRSETWLPTGQAFRGWALARTGHPEGLPLLLRSLPMARRVHRVAEPLFLSLLAEAYLGEGDGGRARRTAEAGIGFAHRTGATFQEADLWRLRGEGALLAGDRTGAEDDFRRAMNVAKNQGASGWALKAAVALATVFCENGDPEKIDSLLSPFRDLLSQENSWVPEVRKGRELFGKYADHFSRNR